MTNIKKRKTLENAYKIITGAASGIANGLFGGGGGMIVVPMLIFFLKYENKVAHATAILIILPLSIISGLLYAFFGNFNLETGLPVSIGVIVGGALGALLLKKLSSKIILVIFSVAMAAAGVKMLVF